jgi:hypothetical protein
VRGAKTLAEFKALKEEALRPPVAKPVTPPPAGNTPATTTPPDLAATPPAEGEPAAPGAGDATPAPEAGATATPPTDPELEPDDDLDLDLGAADGTLTYKQIRLTPAQDDKVGRLAARLMKRNRDWKMEQAIDAAKEKLGIAAPPPVAATNTPNEPQLPKSVDEVNATLKRLKAEKTAHNIGLRFEEAGAIEEQIDQLMEHRSQLQVNAEREESQKATAFQTAWAAADAKAVTLYPFAADPESPGAKRMIEIDNIWKANGDAQYHSAEKPLKLAQMVAAELNIAPARKGTTPAPKPPAGAAPAVIAPKKQVLPGGGSHTTPAPVNTKPADVAKVEGIKDLAGLRAYRKSIGLPE